MFPLHDELLRHIVSYYVQHVIYIVQLLTLPTLKSNSKFVNWEIVKFYFILYILST